MEICNTPMFVRIDHVFMRSLAPGEPWPLPCNHLLAPGTFVYINGMMMMEGAQNDYTINLGKTEITFTRSIRCYSNLILVIPREIEAVSDEVADSVVKKVRKRRLVKI